MTGIAAAVFITVANFPQAWKILRTGDTKSVSWLTYTFLVIGNALWVTYGIFKADIPILIANCISTLMCALILILKLFPGILDFVRKKSQGSKNN